LFFADEDRRMAITQAVEETKLSIQERPEFMVKLMAVDGASGVLASQIRAAVPLEFPISSFDLDLTQVRRDIAALNGVRKANVRIRPGGVLQVVPWGRGCAGLCGWARGAGMWCWTAISGFCCPRTVPCARLSR